MTLKDRIVKNYASIFTAQVLAKILNYFATLYLFVRYLGTDTKGVTLFGEYATVLAFVNFFNFISDFGVAQIVTREVSKEKSLAKTYMGNFFSLQLILSFITFLIIALTVFISHNAYTFNEIIGILITGAGVAIGSLARPFSSIIYAYEQMEYIGLSIFIPSVINLLGVFILTRIHAPFIAFFYIYALNALLTFLLYALFARRITVPFHIEVNKTIYKQLLLLSLPLVFLMIFNFVYNRVDTLMIHFIRNDTEVGYYSYADKFLEALFLIPATFGSVLFPPLVKVYTKQREKFDHLLRRALKYTFAICTIAGLETMMLAEKIISFVNNNHPEKSAIVLQILSITVIISGTYVIYTNILIGINKLKFLAIANAIAVIVNILLNIPFILSMGYIGAAWVGVISEVIILLLYIGYVHHFFGYFGNIIDMIKVAIASLFLAGSIIITYSLNVFFNIALASIIYLLILFALRFFDKEDEQYLRMLLFRK